MRKRNVGTQHIIQVGDRLGIYFLETGGSFCFGADPKDPKISAIFQLNDFPQ